MATTGLISFPISLSLMGDFRVGGIRFGEYLTRQAWDQLADAVKAGSQPSLAADLLVRAHELADNDELRYAFTEAISGLEVAIGEAVRSALGSGEKLQEAANAFWTMPLRAQTTILLGLAKTKQADIEATLEGIEIRNKILHEGWMPSKEENARRRLRDVLSGLLRAAASLLQGPKFRFPSAYAGNLLVPNEAAWEVEYKKIGFDA